MSFFFVLFLYPFSLFFFFVLFNCYFFLKCTKLLKKHNWEKWIVSKIAEADIVLVKCSFKCFYYYRICTDSKDFIKNSSELAVVLISKGCIITKLCKIFRTFIESKTPLRWWRVRRLSNLVFRKFRSTVRALQIEPSYQTWKLPSDTV